MRERRRRAEETNGSSASGSAARGVARPAVGGASSSGGRDNAGGRQANQSQAASSDVQKKTTNGKLKINVHVHVHFIYIVHVHVYFVYIVHVHVYFVYIVHVHVHFCTFCIHVHCTCSMYTKCMYMYIMCTFTNICIHFSTEGDPQSDEERYEPVPLGFGIEAPPPSYKAAISKKNESIFKVSMLINIHVHVQYYIVCVCTHNVNCTVINFIIFYTETRRYRDNSDHATSTTTRGICENQEISRTPSYPKKKHSAIRCTPSNFR